MLEFKKLGSDVLKIKHYMEISDVAFCDISIGAKYMWRDEYVIDYAIVNDTLIIKENGPDYKDNFYYPMGADVDGALKEIENYCRANFMPLQFCCIDDERAKLLKERYYLVDVVFDRDWNDYIYDANDFCTYKGNKFSGQRNHVNKFKKTYPDYTFSVMTGDNEKEILDFLEEYESTTEFSIESHDEEIKVADYVKNAIKLEQVGGVIKVEGKIVAL